MKKFFYISLAAVILTTCTLTACTKENTVPENTTAVTAETTVPTTALTLTESFTTEDFTEPVREIQQIELAVYNPFADAVKVDDEVHRELQEVVRTISDAILLVNADYFMLTENSEYNRNFCDEKSPLEENTEFEYSYFPVNTDFAADETELFNYFRKAFSTKFMTDDKLNECLFAPNEYDNAPNYKTIDGQLCVKYQYNGVPTIIYSNDTGIDFYDGQRAEINAYGSGVAYPPSRVYLSFTKSEEYGWQLDSIEYKEYFPTECELLYNAVSLREDTLNAILGGGKAPENAAVITINGESFTETTLDMSIDEMHGFFEETFREYEVKSDFTDGLSLRGKYIQKYIDDVYFEQDGILYRRDSAPKWYLPELKIDPFRNVEGYGGYQVDSSFIIAQTFYDYVNDKEIPTKIAITYPGDYYRTYPKFDFVYVSSELPIRSFNAEG